MGGPLTPCAVAVTVAAPLRGLPRLSFPLQVVKEAFHTPPQMRPSVDTVTTAGFELVKVMVALDTESNWSRATALICSTSPSFIEADAGETKSTATWLGVGVEPVEQPARNRDRISVRTAARVFNIVS